MNIVHFQLSRLIMRNSCLTFDCDQEALSFYLKLNDIFNCLSQLIGTMVTMYIAIIKKNNVIDATTAYEYICPACNCH